MRATDRQAVQLSCLLDGSRMSERFTSGSARGSGVQLPGRPTLPKGPACHRLRKLNGPNFTWPLMMFAGLVPERILQGMEIHVGKPVVSKSRRELIASLRPNHLEAPPGR